MTHVATSQTCTFLYFELGHFHFFPFICSVTFYSKTSPANTIHLILTSIYTHQVDMLVENVLRQQFIRRSGKKQEVVFKK